MCKLLEDMRNETAFETAILTTIETLRDVGFGESKIRGKIMAKYNLTRSEAMKYMAKKSA